MSAPVRLFALSLAVALLLGNAVGAFAQEDNAEAAPPADVVLPSDTPLQGSPPPVERPATSLEIPSTVTQELENVLGPLQNLRCSVTAIGAIPLMQCDCGDSDR